MVTGGLRERGWDTAGLRLRITTAMGMRMWRAERWRVVVDKDNIMKRLSI